MENFICYLISDYWVRSGMVSEVENGKKEANEAWVVGIWLSQICLALVCGSHLHARIQQNDQVHQLCVAFLISTSRFCIQRL